MRYDAGEETSEEKFSPFTSALTRHVFTTHIFTFHSATHSVFPFHVEVSMSNERSAEPPDSAAVLESMTLLATLSTAATVGESVAERRAGYDPAAQEPAARATARLRSAGRSLMNLLMQLALSRVPLTDDQEGHLPHAVRHFDLLLKLRRVERLTQSMHQHLLSLYPAVSEALVEEARVTHDEVDRLMDMALTDAEGPHLSDVLERGLSFVVWVRHEVPYGGSKTVDGDEGDA